MTEYSDYASLPEYESGWGMYDWQASFEGAASEPSFRTVGGPLHSEDITPLKPSDIAEIESVWSECNVDWGDSAIVALMRLTDGRYATLVAWSDSSGWGCQDAMDWRVAETREIAIEQGLDAAGRQYLGLTLEEDS